MYGILRGASQRCELAVDEHQHKGRGSGIQTRTKQKKQQARWREVEEAGLFNPQAPARSQQICKPGIVDDQETLDLELQRQQQSFVKLFCKPPMSMTQPQAIVQRHSSQEAFKGGEA